MSNSVRQKSKMLISVTINRSNRNRKYNSNMADVRFLNSEVVITQPWFELSYRNFFEIDLKITKRVLLLKPKVDFQFHMAAIFKVL